VEPQEVGALRSRVFEIANDITQERRPPVAAARELDQIYVGLAKLGTVLEPFIGLAAEWDYDVERREEIEKRILVAAETLRRRLDSEPWLS